MQRASRMRSRRKVQRRQLVQEKSWEILDHPVCIPMEVPISNTPSTHLEIEQGSHD